MSQNQKISIYNPITNKETKVDPYGRTAKKSGKHTANRATRRGSSYEKRI